jgi:hypothetical protein
VGKERDDADDSVSRWGRKVMAASAHTWGRKMIARMVAEACGDGR